MRIKPRCLFSANVFPQWLLSANNSKYGFAVALLAITACQACADITLTMVADTATTIPGGVGEFTRFDWLSLDHGTLVFSHGREGIYRFRNGFVDDVVDNKTTLPDGAALFDLRFPAIDGETVAFWGRASAGDGSVTNGLYRVVEDAVSVIADTNTSLPDGDGVFSGFGPPVVERGQFAFKGESESRVGVYSFQDQLRTVADTSMEVPGENGFFRRIADRLQLDNGTVLFNGESTSSDGAIFAEIDGELERIVGENSADLPTIADFSASDGNIVFRGLDGEGAHGIYQTEVDREGRPTLVASADMLEPALDIDYPFPRSSIALVGGDTAAILASTSDGEGAILWLREGEWMQVAKSGDFLNGNRVSRINRFSGNELSDSQLGFIVEFEGNRQAIYLATVPEPSALALLFFGCVPAVRLFVVSHHR